MAALRAAAPSRQSEVDAPVTASWCSTQAKVVKISYTWTITDFSTWQEEMGDALRSSTFSAGADDALKWCLTVHPRGVDEDSEAYVSFYLVLLSCERDQARVRFKFSIINAKEGEVNAMDSRRADRLSDCNAWGFRKFIRRDFLLDKANELLPDDKLTLNCELSVFGDPVHISRRSHTVPFKVPRGRLSQDIGSLLESHKFADVVLHVDGKEFRAQKAILAARSPVFAAMFEHDTSESTHNRVDVTDVDPDVFGDMLQFVYTGRAPSLDDMAADLLVAADKYALDQLKALCEECLCSKLTVETAAELFFLADLHSAVLLKACAMGFINEHAADVAQTPGWLAIVAEQPQLIAEAFESLATQMSQAAEAPSCKRIRISKDQ